MIPVIVRNCSSRNARSIAMDMIGCSRSSPLKYVVVTLSYRFDDVWKRWGSNRNGSRGTEDLGMNHGGCNVVDEVMYGTSDSCSIVSALSRTSGLNRQQCRDIQYLTFRSYWGEPVL